MAVAGGPAAALVDAVAGAEAVGDAGEGAVLALPRAHARLRRHHPAAGPDVAAAAAVVCVGIDHVVISLLDSISSGREREREGVRVYG